MLTPRGAPEVEVVTSTVAMQQTLEAAHDDGWATLPTTSGRVYVLFRQARGPLGRFRRHHFRVVIYDRAG